jgi:hypothetical protein
MARGITSFKWFMAVPGWQVSDDFLLRGTLILGDVGALSIVPAEKFQRPSGDAMASAEPPDPRIQP